MPVEWSVGDRQKLDAYWFRLPLSLRKRWWDETDYGKNDPGDELAEELRRAFDAICP